jgi:hypothetical protein
MKYNITCNFTNDNENEYKFINMSGRKLIPLLDELFKRHNHNKGMNKQIFYNIRTKRGDQKYKDIVKIEIL